MYYKKKLVVLNLVKHATHKTPKTAFKASSKVHTGTMQAVSQ